MRRYRMHLAAPLAVGLALTGCAGVIGGANEVVQARVDGLIQRLERIDDGVLDASDALETVLLKKTARLRQARCRAPYTALRRYALSSPERHAAVVAACGLEVGRRQDKAEGG